MDQEIFARKFGKWILNQYKMEDQLKEIVEQLEHLHKQLLSRVNGTRETFASIDQLMDQLKLVFDQLDLLKGDDPEPDK